jgi:hypothetical protein
LYIKPLDTSFTTATPYIFKYQYKLNTLAKIITKLQTESNPLPPLSGAQQDTISSILSMNELEVLNTKKGRKREKEKRR